MNTTSTTTTTITQSVTPVTNAVSPNANAAKNPRACAIYDRLICNRKELSQEELEEIQNRMASMLYVEDSMLIDLYNDILSNDDSSLIQIPPQSPCTNDPLTFHDSMISFVVTNDLQNSPNVKMDPETRSTLNALVLDCWIELKHNAPENLQKIMCKIEGIEICNCPLAIDQNIKLSERKNLILKEISNLLFQTLAQKLNAEAAFGNIIPVDLSSYIELHIQWQAVLDHALLVLWTDGIVSKLTNPPVLNTVEEIRAYLANPKNQRALGKITELSFFRKGLKVIPPEIQYLANLKELTIVDGQVTSIPAELAGSKLTKLCLNFNQITSIPKELANSKLVEISLSNNQITAIPVELKKSQINKLNLQFNQITTIPKKVFIFIKNTWLFNNQLLFISDKNTKIHGSAGVGREINLFTAYECQSSLSKFFQAVALETIPSKQIPAAFSALNTKDQHLIFEMVYLEAGITSDDANWGELHVFDDMHRFNKALRRAISIKFDRLSQEDKNKVYGEVYTLAGKPKMDDAKWGENNAFDHVLRLIDAMDKAGF